MSEYSPIQKVLHHLVMENKTFKKLSFKFEKKFVDRNLKIKNVQKEQHVFITGMPRSGTTILLNFLYQTGDFGSLTFADMPFALSPNLWSIISKNNKIKSKERIHNDGIHQSLESPEAFEEIFWKTFNNQNLCGNYLFHVASVLHKYKKNRYICKNNYNYKRIRLIKEILPKSKFIIPIRDPYLTSYSLLLQNKRFEILQSKDLFLRKYMNWLGHFEFGLDHKPWFKSIKYFDKSSINYWLEQWFLFHDYLIQNYGDKIDVIFVDYQKLTLKRYSNRLLVILNSKLFSYYNFFKVKKKKTIPLDTKLYEKCKTLKKELLGTSEKHFQ